MREGDPEAMQAVCATQWNLCLPLLQHNLKKRIRTPLYHIAQVLEDIQRFAAASGLSVYSVLCVMTQGFIVCLNYWFYTEHSRTVWAEFNIYLEDECTVFHDENVLLIPL